MLDAPVEGLLPSSGGAVLVRLSPVQTGAKIGEDPVKHAVCAMLLALLPAVAAAGERPEWAFGPERAGEAVPRRPDDGQLKQAPGSTKFYTQAQIDDPMNPPDWFPDEHPPMPQVVAHGNGTTVRAYIGCHLSSGHGHPENSRLPGSTAGYLVRQLADFRSGARGGVTAKIMINIAKGMTEEEVRVASDYFAGLPVQRWTRVVESDTVPKTYYRGNRRLPLAEGGSEPIGNRIRRDTGGSRAQRAARSALGQRRLRARRQPRARRSPGRERRRRQDHPVRDLPWPDATRDRRRAGHRRAIADHHRAPALRPAIRRSQRPNGAADEGSGRQVDRRGHPRNLRL